MVDSRQEFEYSRDKETLNTCFDMTAMKIRFCRALLSGEFKGKVYTIDFESPDEVSFCDAIKYTYGNFSASVVLRPFRFFRLSNYLTPKLFCHSPS